MPKRQQREKLSVRVDLEVLEIVKHVAELERRPIPNLVRNVLADWARTYSPADRQRAA